MTSTDDVLTKDNDEGLKKVLQENYAFLMESSSIEYIIQRECNVTKVGGLLDQKGYGIAMRKGKYCRTYLSSIMDRNFVDIDQLILFVVEDSSYRHSLNTAILKLQESGRITELKKKWWTQKRGGGKCEVGFASETFRLICSQTIDYLSSSIFITGRRSTKFGGGIEFETRGRCVLGSFRWYRIFLCLHVVRARLGGCR